jgi:plastocyanin
MNSRTAAASMLVALLHATPAGAGVIRGVVRVPAARTGTAAADAYPGRAAALPGSHIVPHGLVTDAVVYVEHAPDGVADDPPARPPTLAQRDQMFEPRVLAVAAGTVVDFPNMDPIFHNVFSLSPVRRFDLGRYPRGHSKQVRFTKPGLVNVYCDIHSNMAAFVLVLPHHVFARPDAAGAYMLPELPAGHYALHAWHPDLGDVQREVDVPARGPVDVDLAF